MILARKLDLQQSLRRALVTIEDKELALHIHNNQRLGLISAMLAIFIFGAFYGRYLPQNSLAEKASSEYAEIAVPTSELGAGHVVLLHAYMALTAAATILQLLVVVRTTMLCVLAPGLGLRGPEGSMTRAVLVLRRQSMINLHLFRCADRASSLDDAGLENGECSTGRRRRPEGQGAQYKEGQERGGDDQPLLQHPASHYIQLLPRQIGLA